MRMTFSTGSALFVLLVWAAPVSAQAPRNPRAAQPERPTVATHANAVAPGHVELETGAEWDRGSGGTSSWIAPVYFKLGLPDRLQLGIQQTLVQPVGANMGPADLTLAAKFQFAEGHAILADGALLAGVKFPVGAAGRTTETTDVTVMLISSRQIGSVGVDLNASYTRRSGDGSQAPRNATFAAVAAGWTLRGPLGFTAEVYGYPRTSGPAGAPTTVALLAGPMYRASESMVLDVGAIAKLAGDQPFALFLGVTWNMGSLGRARAP